jgi:hypothetical protein
MNQNDALNILLQAVNVAQAKGAFSLEEAAVIAQSVNVFTATKTNTTTTTTDTTERPTTTTTTTTSNTKTTSKKKASTK